MAEINYEKILLETGLVASNASGIQFPQQFGAMSHEFGGLSGVANFSHQHETTKLKCSTRTTSYSTLHVSTTTKA
ncbi:hypothetical protein ACYA3M_23780 [Klebsiella pneumoniae]|nr:MULTISPECIES: hypothetical protein [Enterobacteriaceae]MDU4210022.1 hypothetical protein [Finegoldia magna]MDU4226263.1 hypothetical protein [Streptococcus sp.]HCH7901881.1 hypothetical protein [Klebsiella oxytoca]HCQ8674808.1 hypothetical protein [Klebsiella variicola]HDR2488835.1 hypothetical protein [Enterobacter ludwigii]